ncbi:MAG: response regulator [Hyphomicrobiales bacterium]
MTRILIVDDEPLISLLMEDWLTEMGYEVVGPAATIEEGVDLAGSASLDGAILDLRLGDQKSYPVASVLVKRGVPFAFATGDENLQDQDDFKDAPILVKPFDFDAVKGIIDKMLARA